MDTNKHLGSKRDFITTDRKAIPRKIVRKQFLHGTYFFGADVIFVIQCGIQEIHNGAFQNISMHFLRRGNESGFMITRIIYPFFAIIKTNY
jgi:hypothetical protein